MTWTGGNTGGGSYTYSHWGQGRGSNPHENNLFYRFDVTTDRYVDTFDNVFTAEYFEGALQQGLEVKVEIHIPGMGTFIQFMMPKTQEAFERAQMGRNREYSRPEPRKPQSSAPPWFDSSIFEETGRIFEEFFKQQQKPPPPPKRESPKPTGSPLMRLCELAGMPFDIGVDKRRVYRMALRKTHPDSGGSHEAVVEVQELARRLGLIK